MITVDDLMEYDLDSNPVDQRGRLMYLERCIHGGIYKDGVNQSARKKPGADQNWIAHEWGWAWPKDTRMSIATANASERRLISFRPRRASSSISC